MLRPDTITSKFLDKVQTFEALRKYRDFRWLWINQLLFQVGWWMMLLVMVWLSYELTSSPFMVALFTAARLSPSLFAPIVGAIADNMNRKNLIIIGTVIQAGLTATLAVLLAAGAIEFWQLVVIGFFEGITFKLCYTTAYAMSADIMEEKDLTNAIALLVVAMDITKVVGPAVGGVLIATMGASNCTWAAVGVFGVGALALFGISKAAIIIRAGQSMGAIWKDLVEGAKYVIHNRDMVTVLTISMSANIFMWPTYQTFMPIFAKDNLGLGPDGLGFLLMASGGGALVGAIIIASLGNFQWRGLMYLTTTFFAAVFFGFFAMSRVYVPAMVLVTLFGLFSAGFGTMQATLMLKLSPPEMRGRSVGFLNMAIGVYAFGTLAVGGIAEALGTSLTTGISCGILAVVVVAVAVGMSNLRRL